MRIEEFYFSAECGLLHEETGRVLQEAHNVARDIAISFESVRYVTTRAGLFGAGKRTRAKLPKTAVAQC